MLLEASTGAGGPGWSGSIDARHRPRHRGQHEHARSGDRADRHLAQRHSLSGRDAADVVDRE